MEKTNNKVTEISVSYTPSKAEKPAIASSADAYAMFLEFFPKDTIALQEHFMVMYLNHSNKVLGIYPVSSGGMTGTVADIRLILAVALKTAATGILLAHNHPSGNIKPSRTDIALTVKVREAAKLMDIKLMDHFIISPQKGTYYSFADEGEL
jgi:DNA repair protein RadC